MANFRAFFLACNNPWQKKSSYVKSRIDIRSSTMSTIWSTNWCLILSINPACANVWNDLTKSSILHNIFLHDWLLIRSGELVLLCCTAAWNRTDDMILRFIAIWRSSITKRGWRFHILLPTFTNTTWVEIIGDEEPVTWGLCWLSKFYIKIEESWVRKDRSNSNFL